MHKTCLIEQNSKHCILFFNGWGMDANAVKHLRTADYDVCMFNNYSHLNFNENDFNKYQSVSVIAWSLGVWVAARVLQNVGLEFKSKVAVNGTLNPLSQAEGIPETVFSATLEYWNTQNRDKFNMRMLGGRSAFMNAKHLLSGNDIQSQINELLFLKTDINKGVLPEFTFDKAVLGKNDLIFSFTNQQNYWQNKVRIVEKDWPHYPFGDLQTWDEFLNI